MQVRSPLAYVRCQDGTTVALSHGKRVPADVDAAHLERLQASGVIGEPDAEPPPPAGDSEKDGKPRPGGKSS